MLKIKHIIMLDAGKDYFSFHISIKNSMKHKHNLFMNNKKNIIRQLLKNM